MVEWKVALPLLIIAALIFAILVVGRRPTSPGSPRSSMSSGLLPLPKPAAPPYTAPTWSSRGAWAVPFAVRYAVAFCDASGREGPMSDWSSYVRSSQFSNPILSRFPVTPHPGVTSIQLYRQFEGHQPIALDRLPYPYYQRYTDRSGDDY